MKVQDPERGSVAATCAAMSFDEAYEAAEQFVKVLTLLVTSSVDSSRAAWSAQVRKLATSEAKKFPVRLRRGKLSLIGGMDPEP